MFDVRCPCPCVLAHQAGLIGTGQSGAALFSLLLSSFLALIHGPILFSILILVLVLVQDLSQQRTPMRSEEPVICCASFTLLSIRFNCYCLSAFYFSPPNWEITALPLFTHLVGCPSAVHPGVPLLLLEIHLHLELVLLCHPLDSIRN